MTTETLEARIPTTVSLCAEFSSPFERHYVSEKETSGRFWLALEENGDWSAYDDDVETSQVVVAHFSTPIKIFFADDQKNSMDWAYDLQDIKVKYTPEDEELKQAFIPISVDKNGFADYEMNVDTRAKIKIAIESCIDENLMSAEETFIEKMGGKI